MGNGIKLCMSCMNAVPSDAARCPNCGYNGKQKSDDGSLPIGFRLQGRYVVGMRRAEDGDSIGYVGYDCTLNRIVEIREFFLPHGCSRDPETLELVPNKGTELFFKTSLMDFSDLYKNLRKIEGQPGLIRVSDFVEANNTAYAIVDQFDGITLREFLSIAGGSITPEQAVKLLTTVFHAVEAIHNVNLIHRGISPETIFVNRNGDVKLGGFATSQVRTKGTEVAGKLYGGYAAPEQYATTMWQGTATDVYALAATFYRCITGVTPQDAEQRRSYDTVEPAKKVRETVGIAVSRAISGAMILNSKERTQTALEFLEIIDRALAETDVEEDAAVSSARAGVAMDAEPDDEPDGGIRSLIGSFGKGKNKKTVLITCMAAAAVVLVVLMIFIGRALINAGKTPVEPDEPEVTTVVVPDYVGEYYADIVFDRDNFKYSDEMLYESDVDVDKVVRQDPPAGTEVEPGQVIKLYVNKGTRVTMIELREKSVDRAIAELTELGIDYVLSYEETEQYPPGIVIKQSIAEGTQVNPRTQQVTMTVSKAPPVVVDPNPPPADDGNNGEGNGNNG